MAFENFDPIYVELKVEWVCQSCCPLWPFLAHAYTPHSSQLVIHVTNSVSDVWEAHLSRSALENILPWSFYLNWHTFLLLLNCINGLNGKFNHIDMKRKLQTHQP